MSTWIAKLRSLFSVTAAIVCWGKVHGKRQQPAIQAVSNVGCRKKQKHLQKGAFEQSQVCSAHCKHKTSWIASCDRFFHPLYPQKPTTATGKNDRHLAIQVALVLQGLLKRNSFLQPLENKLRFPPTIKGTHRLQVAMFGCFLVACGPGPGMGPLGSMVSLVGAYLGMRSNPNGYEF